MISVAIIPFIFILGENKNLKKNWSNLNSLANLVGYTALFGAFFALEAGTHYTALNLTSAINAVVVKDLSSIFIFLFGFFMLNERDHALQRFFATVLVLIGTIMLSLG